jgi:hypothetical protein
MRLIITRYQSDNKQTIGSAELCGNDGSLIANWHSLELPNLGNQKRISRIPQGKYKARKHNSPKFGISLWLQDVPNRTAILIHKGNYHTDILGCILLGKGLSDINKDGFVDVTQSTVAVKELMDLLIDVDGIMVEIYDKD